MPLILVEKEVEPFLEWMGPFHCLLGTQVAPEQLGRFVWIPSVGEQTPRTENPPEGADFSRNSESKMPFTVKAKLMAPCGWKAKTVLSWAKPHALWQTS